jgi:hypothetical protein
MIGFRFSAASLHGILLLHVVDTFGARRVGLTMLSAWMNARKHGSEPSELIIRHRVRTMTVKVGSCVHGTIKFSLLIYAFRIE